MAKKEITVAPAVLARNLRRGTRIMLMSMADDPDPVQVGTWGTVVGVHAQQSGSPSEWVQIDVRWDGGRELSLTIPPDRYRLAADIFRCPWDG